jgi:beta-phosphoglucomutase-like phosphatase (HAD superfamily)
VWSPFEGSDEFIHQFRGQGFKIAVLTSNHNFTGILKAANLDHSFDGPVDGILIHAQRLTGKPAADTYLMASVIAQGRLGRKGTCCRPWNRRKIPAGF